MIMFSVDSVTYLLLSAPADERIATQGTML